MYRWRGRGVAFTDFTAEKKARFIAELRKMPNVSRAARLAKVSRRTAYNHYETDETFRAEWDDALTEGVEALEESAWQQAKSGSETLTIFLLKAHKPDKYRETTRHELTGKDGAPLKAYVSISPDDWDE